LHVSPLDVAEPFRRQIEARRRSWVLTSATLAVGHSFALYQERMGLQNARTALWPSPFDYPNNALLYLPRGLPEPAAAEFTDKVVDACLPVLRASRGRAFLLFTTLRAMRRAHELLAARLRAEGLELPLLLQGEATKTSLLERFRRSGNAVLIAAASFWEGVDVRGEALSLVVIDKLPFAPPDDPILAARLAWLTRAGRNAFLEYQVPEAAIALKQGAGRLIRDESDRGILMICDRRLTERSYGKHMLASLPPMRRTHTLADVAAFFAASTADDGRRDQ
jgi:ATP-dependent DNA helicase DinG